MANLIRWSPWNELFNLQSQMDQIFGSALSQNDAVRAPEEMASLPLDIRQGDDAYIIEASVPGFSPDRVEVTYDEGVLTIRGTVDSASEEAKGGYVRRERRASSVFRQVTLPAEVRADDISAAFENGVLTITVPRTQKAQPRRIPVGSGSTGERTGTVVDTSAKNGRSQEQASARADE